MILLLIFVISVSVCDGAGLRIYNNISDHQYNAMPTLFQLDNFDRCIHLYKPTLYCYATIQLTPVDTSNYSESWRIIWDVISLDRYYRHDKIRHGICIPKECDHIDVSDYAVGNGTAKLWTGLSKCYTRKYGDLGLVGNVIKLHCEDDMPFYEVDLADKIFAFCIIFIIVLTVIGTFVDLPLGIQYNTSRNGLKNTKGYEILKAFSFANNWKRFQTLPTTDDMTALAPIQGIRVYNIGLVIMCHTVMMAFNKPIHNTDFVENATTKLENALISNGTYVCQTSFCISGWLLSYSMCTFYENKKVHLKQLVKIFLNRYFRLLPILLLTIGFHATWLRHFGRGPIWEHTVGREFEFCRKNWIANLLFINNYYKVEEMCLQQTWYLAVEMQGFIVAIFIMMLVINKPQHANKIFASAIILLMAVSFVHHYVMEYDIVFRSYPETLYTVYRELEFYLRYHGAGHVNMPSYFHGLVCGYYFYIFRRDNIKLPTNKLKQVNLFAIAFIVPIFVVIIAARYYMEGSEFTRIEAALYQSLSRYIFAVGISMIIFLFVFDIGWYMKSACTWPPLQTLAKVTFSVYLTHTAHMRINTGMIRSPLYVTEYRFFTDTLGDIAVSFLIGTLVYVLVEMPAATLQKLLLQSGHKKHTGEHKEKKT